MDFDKLPDNFFLEIFRQLPFEQKCRIGAVSRSFRRMSKIAVSQTTSLRLDGMEFTNLPVSSLLKIFDLCRENLEKINLPGKFIETLAEFSFPRLAKISLVLDVDHGFDWVDVILANNAAVKEFSVVLFPNHSGQFVSTGVTFENLTRLDVWPERFNGRLYEDENFIVDGNFLRLLTGRCPNLKRLILCRCQLHDQAASEEFFAHCPTLEQLNFGFSSRLNFLEMESFWRVESLKKLVISKVSDFVSQRGDDFLVKIANSFPHLAELRVSSLEITNRGVGALASLNNLAVVSLNGDNGDLEASLFQLAKKGKLQEVCLNCWISPSTFLTVVSKCPNLAKLFLGGIRNVENAEAAAGIVKSLGRWNRKRDIKILFGEPTDAWQSPEVASALVEIKDKAELIVTFWCQ